MTESHQRVTELRMTDGSLRRYLGAAPEADYLSALGAVSYSASPATVAALGLAAGRVQVIEPAIKASEQPDSRPPSAAPQEEETMSTAEAIRTLAKIARTPGHPQRAKARKAILALPDDSGAAKASTGAGVTYLSPYAAELDRKMGIGDAGRGVRVEGSQLILSATGRGLR
jgi:hypothetical protein